MAVEIDALWELPELGDLFCDFSGHEMASQPRFGADAHDNLQGVRRLNVSQ